MTATRSSSYTSFDGQRRLASGPLKTVALAVKQAVPAGESHSILIFDDETGKSIELDTRGSDEEMLALLAYRFPEKKESIDEAAGDEEQANEPRGRGRPKLGVVPREVTLLPRHWEWLATQPGGASVALRKLVEEARRTHREKDAKRQAHERAYAFMSALAGDLPGFEEAIRALFADKRERFLECMSAWPADIRDYAERLAALE